jgi:hypothetical protein
MNEALYDTVRKNLTPSKITGNLFEVNICKKSFLMPAAGLINKVGNRIIFQPKPIRTPAHDDIVTKIDFCEESREFLNEFKSRTPLADKLAGDMDTEVCKTQEERELAREGREVALTVEEKATLQVVNDVVDEVTLEDQVREIDAIVTEARREADKFVRKHRADNRIKNSSSYYQYLKTEMDQMKAYFEGFFAIMTEVADTAAEELCNKEEVE